MDTFFCYKCGHKLPADSDFCQFCGTDQSSRPRKAEVPQITEKKGSSKKPLTILLILAAILIIAAVVVFVVIKPFGSKKQAAENETTQQKETDNAKHATESAEEKPADKFSSMSLEEKIASSQPMSISDYKKNFVKIKGDNIHLAGYVIENAGGSGTQSFYIAEEQKWPYDFTPKDEYFGTTGFQTFDEWMKEREEWDKVQKTPGLFCALKKDGITDRQPWSGEYIDVYFIAEDNERASVYYIGFN